MPVFLFILGVLLVLSTGDPAVFPTTMATQVFFGGLTLSALATVLWVIDSRLSKRKDK